MCAVCLVRLAFASGLHVLALWYAVISGTAAEEHHCPGTCTFDLRVQSYDIQVAVAQADKDTPVITLPGQLLISMSIHVE